MQKDFLAQATTPQITFFGATESIHGSMHLLETGRSRILLDCGRQIEPAKSRGSARSRMNRAFPFDPTSLDAVLLTHAHSDHCGNLPYLVKQGYHGPIYCSAATRDLIEVILNDNARIHEMELERSRYSSHANAIANAKSAFDFRDVEDMLDQCEVIELNQAISIAPSVTLRASDSAHVLGSVMFEVEFEFQGIDKRFVFTGDLGRRGLPLVGTPNKVPAADLVVCESTYGGRFHEPFESTMTKLANVINHSINQGGKVLVPAFSLGRIHLVRYCLVQAMERGDIPHVPIYIDSPLTLALDDVYRDFYDSTELSIQDERCEWLSSPDDAWFRTTESGPAIIVASGGMCDGGRILDHLKYHIDDPRASLVLVSHQSDTSLGSQLLAPTPTVRFHGRLWNKWINVVQIAGFSAHADTNDFEYLLREAVENTGKVCLVHGEDAQKQALKSQLEGLGFRQVIIPELADTVAI